MKKSLIALAALGAFAGAASAQSSVTLFGIVDVGARAVKNDGVGTVKSLTSNGLATSRLGLRGVEDLGGGLNAGFWLEGELAPDVGGMGTSGTNGKFFNRRSTVSLFGKFGEVRLGRDYVPTFSNLAAFDAYGAVGIGNILNLITTSNTANSAGNLGSTAGTVVRADNAISYFLPAGMGGVYGTVMAAAGEGTTATNGNNRFIGGRVGFANGPFDVAAAYGKTQVPGSSDLKLWNVGGSLNFGIAKVMALYHRGEFTPGGQAQREQRVWSVGGSVPIGAGEIRATYARSDISGGGPVGLRGQDDARQYAIGYVHNLSKRTAIYADIGKLDNRGNSALTIPGGTTNAAFIAGGRDSKAAGIGVRHSF